MKLSLKYFGQIAQRAGKEDEIFDLDDNINLDEVRRIVHEKYALNGLPFQVAVNRKFSDPMTELNENDEVAFLPPFAGG